MSVLLETSVGDITIDLFVDDAPKCCENFLKLCKIKYYNFSPIYNVQRNSTLQTGDPIGPESTASVGGSSIWGLPSTTTKQPSKPSAQTFKPDFPKKRTHETQGTVTMATNPSPTHPDTRLAASQFLITLAPDLSSRLDPTCSPFGEVVEGFDALEKINAAFVDASGRPLQDIRILHTVVLDDPFPDPEGLLEPPGSPVPSAEQRATVRIAHDEMLDTPNDPEKLEQLRREREARAQALTLELIGDLPFAEVTPPEQILFVCKLNPVTQDADLELIFSRFGTILSCEVVRDKKSGDSLQYAFVEFKDKTECERAYAKMQGVLVDDHRIHVDFSQSVSKLAGQWREGAKSRTARHKGGFGGFAQLEERRQFRGEEGRYRGQERGGGYGYVEEREEGLARKRGGSRSRSRSSSPKRRERREERSGRFRSRSRSPRRRDGYGRDRERERDSRDRKDDRHRGERRRPRSRDRYHDNRDHRSRR